MRGQKCHAACGCRRIPIVVRRFVKKCGKASAVADQGRDEDRQQDQNRTLARAAEYVRMAAATAC
jgi:hypothetical protein